MGKAWVRQCGMLEIVWKGHRGVPGLSSAPWVTLSKSELSCRVLCFHLLNWLMDGGSSFFLSQSSQVGFLFFPELELYFLKCFLFTSWDGPMTLLPLLC